MTSTPTIAPPFGSIGAILHGIDLGDELTDGDVAAVRSALVSARVIFFRDQDITPTQQVAFARRFGALTPAHPLLGGLDDDHHEVLVLDSADYPLGVGSRGSATSYNERRHTDVTFSERPPAATMLAARMIPTRSGDTLWVDLISAYATLSEPIRTLLDDHLAVHDSSATFSRFRDEDPTGDRLRSLARLRARMRARASTIRADHSSRGPRWTRHVRAPRHAGG